MALLAKSIFLRLLRLRHLAARWPVFFFSPTQNAPSSQISRRKHSPVRDNFGTIRILRRLKPLFGHASDCETLTSHRRRAQMWVKSHRAYRFYSLKSLILRMHDIAGASYPAEEVRVRDIRPNRRTKGPKIATPEWCFSCF